MKSMEIFKLIWKKLIIGSVLCLLITATIIPAYAAWATTGGTVSIGGRVTSAYGSGVPNAVVTINADEELSARTNQLGYYVIRNVPIGDFAVVTVASKTHQFEPVGVVIFGGTSNLNLVALP